MTVKSNLNARAYNSMRALHLEIDSSHAPCSREIPPPATTKNEGLADVAAANPFRYPDFTREVEAPGGASSPSPTRRSSAARTRFLEIVPSSL